MTFPQVALPAFETQVLTASGTITGVAPAGELTVSGGVGRLDTVSQAPGDPAQSLSGSYSFTLTLTPQ